MRVLCYGDGPCVSTGFGTVTRNIFLPLAQQGLFTDLNFYAINYTGEPHNLPFKLYPARNGMVMDPDPYGRERFCAEVTAGRWPLDILFVVQDHFTVQPFLARLAEALRQQVAAGQRTPVRIIYYCPVDNDFVPPEYISWMPTVDYPVAYMHWSARILLETVPALHGRLRTIYHGSDPGAFHPISAEERQAFRRNTMQVRDDQPLIVCVNRNQPRKDPARTIQAFRRVRERYPDAVLYLHMNAVDQQGHSLEALAQQLRMPAGSVRFPLNFNEGVGVPVAELNRVYNAADVVVTTARGEGFGLTVMEAMTAGRCVVAPDHTSFTELLADGRGLLTEPEAHKQVIAYDNNLLRAVASVERTADAIGQALEMGATGRDAIGSRARAWALAHTWEGHIAPQWGALFREAYASIQAEMAPPVAKAEGVGLVTPGMFGA